MTRAKPRRFIIDMFSSRDPSWCMPEADVDRVRGTLPSDWELLRLREEADGSGDGGTGVTPERIEALEDAEVYCGFGIPSELFEATAKLRWVHSGSAGVGGSLHGAILEGDVIFTNSAGTHGVPVAEHALAMMFYFARGFDQLQVGRGAPRWTRDRVTGFDSPIGELTDSVVGILGYGGIGREVGRRAKGLGMQVWATARNPRAAKPPSVDRLFGPTDLTEVLAGSDYVVVALPHTDETDGLIGATELAAMKDTAVLINVARGRIIDEDALIDVLKRRKIRGAGLDVYQKEPLPSYSPLWEFDNVCLTPHMAGVSPRFWERETELIIENVQRYLDGEPMLNVVNKQAGY